MDSQKRCLPQLTRISPKIQRRIARRAQQILYLSKIAWLYSRIQRSSSGLILMYYSIVNEQTAPFIDPENSITVKEFETHLIILHAVCDVISLNSLITLLEDKKPIPICANAIPGVHVAVLEDSQEIVGFFPFQKTGDTSAGPVGGRLSDFQGIILRPGQSLSAKDLLRACDLKVFHFDHLLTDQDTFSRYHRHMAESPFIDLAQGLSAYTATRKKQGYSHIANLKNRRRKFERGLGSLRLELYSDSTKAFHKVLEWKRAQCKRTGVVDFLNWEWTVGMLEEIWSTRTPLFSGMLSVLYCEDTIVAAHLGMRSKDVFHYWFPAYDMAYSKYSPGGILLLQLIESLESEGIRLIDLGKGKDPYKKHFSTGSLQLAEGCAWLPSITALGEVTKFEMELFREHSPLLKPLKSILRRFGNSNTGHT